MRILGASIIIHTLPKYFNPLLSFNEEIASKIMEQVKRHQPDEKPLAVATDGKGTYREAILETWGRFQNTAERGSHQ